MNLEYVEFLATDGVQLQGLWYSPAERPSTCVLHLHGLAGNFYENGFIHYLGRELVKKRVAFLTFNNRGHDYISDLRRVKATGDEWIRGGAAYESFVDCQHDVAGAANYARQRGVNAVVLQGHSSGANKAVFTLPRLPDVNWIGLVLLSPCDDIGLMVSRRGALLEQDVAAAEAMVKSGSGDKLLSREVFGDYPLSAATYLADFRAGSSMDTFPYRLDRGGFEALSMVRCPILAVFGTEGEPLAGLEVHDVLKRLQDNAPSARSFGTRIIEGAPHNYSSKEAILATEVVPWVERLQPDAR